MKWVQLCGSLNILWHCFSLGLELKHLFQSCGHCWVPQNCWHIECSTFTASSFRIWNSSTGISSPPLDFFLFFWNSAFRCLYLSFAPLLFISLPFTAICKASPDSHFAFLHFFSTGMVLISVSCTMSRTSFYSSSGTLSIRSIRSRTTDWFQIGKGVVKAVYCHPA